jgi:hypothetical protein
MTCGQRRGRSGVLLDGIADFFAQQFFNFRP